MCVNYLRMCVYGGRVSINAGEHKIDGIAKYKQGGQILFIHNEIRFGL